MQIRVQAHFILDVLVLEVAWQSSQLTMVKSDIARIRRRLHRIKVVVRSYLTSHIELIFVGSTEYCRGTHVVRIQTLHTWTQGTSHLSHGLIEKL